MARIVGDSDTYPLEVNIVLDLGNGDQHLLGRMRVDAPSISTVAKVFDTKSGPLVGWAYKTGLEGCQKLEASGESIGSWTYEELYARLKLKGFTPYTKRQKAADRGNEAHAVLEDLANGEPFEKVLKRANQIEGEARGYAEGVLQFWRDQRGVIEVLMAEQPVAGLYPKPFAGTLDLYALRAMDPQDEEPTRFVLSDLKTSKDVYEEHATQLDGYHDAVRQARPDLPAPEQHTVILAKEDGTYAELVVPSVPQAWRAALEGWYAKNELHVEFTASKGGKE